MSCKHCRNKEAMDFLFNHVRSYVVLRCSGFNPTPPFVSVSLVPSTADASGDMPTADCPEGASQTCCQECHNRWNPLWLICAGNPACQAQVYSGYLACLANCPTGS